MKDFNVFWGTNKRWKLKGTDSKRATFVGGKDEGYISFIRRAIWILLCMRHESKLFIHTKVGTIDRVITISESCL
jgi:hypothetical protein